MKTVTQNQGILALEKALAGGNFVSITWVKKDGTETTRTVRKNVKKGLSSSPTAKPAYNPEEKGLIWVYDINGDHRVSIIKKNILFFTAAGVTYRLKALVNA